MYITSGQKHITDIFIASLIHLYTNHNKQMVHIIFCYCGDKYSQIVWNVDEFMGDGQPNHYIR